MKMAAYCRVSTEKAEQLSSLKNQRDFFLQYAQKCGDTLVKVYADEGISGKSIKKRDAFLSLLADSANHYFDYVAVKDISRFARNTSDFLFGIRTLRSNGVDVRFLSNNQTVIGESEFVLTVFAALAQEESASLSKRVVFGKRQNAKKGRVPNLVYGYDKKDTYTLQINKDESEIVKLIFKLYLNGAGTRAIAAKLNLMNIPTKKRAEWSPKTIRRMLENPIYIGKLVNNKSTTGDFLTGTRIILPDSEHFIHNRPELKIIDISDFEQVQRLIKERCEILSDMRYSSAHLFSNIIQCSECNRFFTANTHSSNVEYRCPNRKNCKNLSAILENEILSAIKKELISFFKKDERIYVSFENTDSEIFLQSVKYTKQKRDKYMELFLNNLISLEELKKGLDKISAGLEYVNTEMSCFPSFSSDIISEVVSQHRFTNCNIRALIDKISVSSCGDAEIFFL